MVQDYMYIKSTPWSNLGAQFESKQDITSGQEIIQSADLDWEVGATKMYTELHRDVFNYHAIYRTNDKDLIGVVNKSNPILIQNRDSFNLVNHLIGNQLSVETAGHLSGNRHVFGCFKVEDDFKLMDDDIDEYVVILNDHLQVDGKITILYTPIRVVCLNSLHQAMNTKFAKFRVPLVVNNIQQNMAIGTDVMETLKVSRHNLSVRSEKLYKIKIDKDRLDKILDLTFPFIEGEGHEKSNMATEIARETFKTECLEKDDLQNYRGTGYQVFQSMVDFSQHYFKDVTKAYDLTYKMSMLTSSGTPADLVKKTLNQMQSWAA